MVNVSATLPNEVHSSAPLSVHSDFYLVGLWSYCKGYRIKEVQTITYCSSPTTHFWFDAADVWGVRHASLQSELDFNLKRAAGWMGAAFAITLVCNVLEFVTGLFAMSYRRWSLLTAIFSAVGHLSSTPA